MNKRGIELMGRTIIEILVAIVCVGLLIYAGMVLFQTYFGNQRENQAKGQIESLDKILDEAQQGEEYIEHLLAPTGWHVVSFDESSNFNDDYFEKPDAFFGKNTVCICKDKDCEICKETELPLLKEGQLVHVIIPVDIIIMKLENNFDVKIKEYEAE
jgi:type II secretory pathway pseudopilin PulG